MTVVHYDTAKQKQVAEVYGYTFLEWTNDKWPSFAKFEKAEKQAVKQLIKLGKAGKLNKDTDPDILLKMKKGKEAK